MSVADPITNLVRKAAGDIAVVKTCVERAEALDIACFHAHQAAEKFLRAYLLHRGVELEAGLELPELIEHGQAVEPSFSELMRYAECLAPYTLDLRHDREFWPSLGTARSALNSAQAIRDFVRARIPDEAWETE